MISESCAREGCGQPATHAPKLKVPAQGYSIVSHQPIEVYVGLHLCRRHCRHFRDDFDWQHFPDLQAAIKGAARGKVPPDFERTFFTCVEIDGQEYQAYVRARDNAKALKKALH